MNAQVFIAFLCYCAILLGIGIFASRKLVSSADFIMGNRSLNFWVISLSAHASDMSSWLFMGLPSAIFLSGMSGSWIALGVLGGMFCNWQFIAKRLRLLTEKYGCCTLPSFFEKHYRDESGILRILTALTAAVFLTFYLAAGLIGLGLLFESIFGIDYYLGLSIAAGVAVIYTLTGGFISIAWTDLFQALFLILVVVLIPLFTYFTLPNGWHSIIESAQNKGISLSLFSSNSFEGFLTALFLFLVWSLGYFGQPHIVSKFIGIKNAEEMNKAKYLGMTWMLIAITAATAVGLVGIAYFEQTVLTNPQMVFVEMVKSQHRPFAASFILCGIIAASTSTMASQILVCASVLSEDFYRHIFKKPSSAKHLLLATKGCVVLVSLFSLGLAFKKSATVLEAVEYAWSGLGSSFGPLMLMTLYSKTANRNGAIAGIIVGAVVSGFWSCVNPYITEYPIPSMVPGFSLSLLSIYIVSAMTPINVEAARG